MTARDRQQDRCRLIGALSHACGTQIDYSIAQATPPTPDYADDKASKQVC